MDMDAITEITPQHPHWPAGLRDLNERMPQRLWVRGATAVLALPGVALVGSRASTAQGNVNARQIADRSGDAGFAVISGLAYGIDAAAHSTAVSRQMPTVAYLATGVDRIYPAGHQDLAQAIVDSGGALVSAYPPGSAPPRERFLERNGLNVTHAPATAVVEAGWYLGSVLHCTGWWGGSKGPKPWRFTCLGVERACDRFPSVANSGKRCKLAR